MSRLAELVVHLTGCPAPVAVDAVTLALDEHEHDVPFDPLAVVATAMVQLKRGLDLRDGTGRAGPAPA